MAYFTDDSLLPENMAPLMITAAPYGPVWMLSDGPAGYIPLTTVRWLGAAVATILIAGCASATSVLPAQPPDMSGAARSMQPKAFAAAPRARKSPLTLRIVIPRPKHRGARFVSPGALGMRLAFQGPTPVNEAVGLTPASNPHCVKTPSGSNCSFAFSLASGPYTASVRLYDEAPVNGAIPAGAKLLSTLSNAPFNVVRGKTNTVGFDLAGVPASFSFIDIPLATAGNAFPTPQHFTVIAKDADGFVIAGTYDNAVTLQDADTSGATSIATLGADHPGADQLLSSSDIATIAYSGLAIAPVTITASASGAADGTANFAPALQPIVVTTNNTINPAFVGLDLYATSGAGSSKHFTVSEIGWTDAPFDKSIAVSGSCSSIASVSPASGTSFTAAAGGSPGTCTDTLSDGAGQQQPIVVAYSRFSKTGSEQDFALPAGVSQIVAIVRGAQGANIAALGAGGLGAIVTAPLPITPLDTLAIFVGGQNGYNGGGFSGANNGGGASDIREGGTALANRIVVAGGGGGGGGPASAPGGAGGFSGASGGSYFYNGLNFPGGGGGTQSVGGSNGGDITGCGAIYIAAGLGQGGSVEGTVCQFGGGGGGGYYGGGAGASGDAAGGGGGGSSFAVFGSFASYTDGAQAGDGSVIVQF